MGIRADSRLDKCQCKIKHLSFKSFASCALQLKETVGRGRWLVVHNKVIHMFRSKFFANKYAEKVRASQIHEITDKYLTRHSCPTGKPRYNTFAAANRASWTMGRNTVVQECTECRHYHLWKDSEEQ